MSRHAGVRRLDEGDIEAYLSIRLEMLLDSPASFGSAPEDDRCSDPDFVQGIVTHPTNALIGCFDAEGRCQSVAGLVRADKVKRGHIAEIFGVYTRPEARRRGLGRRVMERTLEYAQSLEGLEVIGLSVSAEAPAAQAMYESFGFQEWGREPRALRIGDRRPTEVHMWRAVVG